MMIGPRSLSNIYENMYTVGGLEGGGKPRDAPRQWVEERRESDRLR